MNAGSQPPVPALSYPSLGPPVDHQDARFSPILQPCHNLHGNQPPPATQGDSAQTPDLLAVEASSQAAPPALPPLPTTPKPRSKRALPDPSPNSKPLQELPKRPRTGTLRDENRQHKVSSRSIVSMAVPHAVRKNPGGSVKDRPVASQHPSRPAKSVKPAVKTEEEELESSSNRWTDKECSTLLHAIFDSNGIAYKLFQSAGGKSVPQRAFAKVR